MGVRNKLGVQEQGLGSRTVGLVCYGQQPHVGDRRSKEEGLLFFVHRSSTDFVKMKLSRVSSSSRGQIEQLVYLVENTGKYPGEFPVQG